MALPTPTFQTFQTFPRFHASAAALLLLVAVISVGVGCEPAPPVIELGEGEGEGEIGEGEGEGEGEALAATAYCESIAPLFCPFYQRCGRMDVASDAECRQAFVESCETRFEPRFLPLAALGLLELSQAGLEACGAHLDTVACDEQFFELEGPCADIWRGTVPAGGVCGLDTETFVCAPGTACTLTVSFCGTCEAILDDGAVCRVGDEGSAGTCGPGGTCGDADVCEVRPTVGEACVDGGTPCALPARCSDDGVCRHPAYVGVGDACDNNNRCPYLSRCSGSVCVATVPRGGSCSESFECDAGSYCDDGACAALSVDGPCTVDDACASGTCEAGRCAPFSTLCVGAP